MSRYLRRLVSLDARDLGRRFETRVVHVFYLYLHMLASSSPALYSYWLIHNCWCESSCAHVEPCRIQ